MHACGHDNHVAILLRFSTILAAITNYLQDSVKFIFQPAEEGRADIVLREVAYENHRPDVVVELYLSSNRVGESSYLPRDDLHI